mgnify:CR=1 FL=1
MVLGIDPNTNFVYSLEKTIILIVFLFTNNRGCDLIKKKTGIIKPEGEIVKERLFITPEYTTAKEIKKIRKAEIR